MGGNLCCLRPTSPKRRLSKGSSTKGESGSKIRPKGIVDGQQVNIPVLSLVSPKMRPKGVVDGQQVNIPVLPHVSPAPRDIAMVGNSTLGECLLASPSMNEPGSDIHIIKQLPKGIYLSSPELPTEFYTPRNSFSSPMDGLCSRKRWKIDEGGGGDEFSDSPESRKQSDGKLKKRVSFKLPEEADIFIFYSPGEGLDEKDQ